MLVAPLVDAAAPPGELSMAIGDDVFENTRTADGGLHIRNRTCAPSMRRTARALPDPELTEQHELISRPARGPHRAPRL
jgi:hypothetical protein